MQDEERSEAEGAQGALPSADRAAVARADYYALRDHLRRAVVGHADAIHQLALIGVEAASGDAPRVLLVGPSGVGKTLMATTLAAALGRPSVVIDVASLAETNWAGVDIRDGIRELRRCAERMVVDDADVPEAMARGVIVLDELDKIAVRAMDGSSAGYRRGKQESLLALLGGGTPIHYRTSEAWNAPLETWTSDRALILALGVFEGLPADAPITPSAAIDLGLMPELVERLGHAIRLEPLTGSELVAVLKAGLAGIRRQYARMGYHLRVTDEVLDLVAERVASGAGRAGPRSGVAWLTSAAHRGLVTLLERRAEAGTTYVLTPDAIPAATASATALVTVSSATPTTVSSPTPER